MQAKTKPKSSPLATVWHEDRLSFFMSITSGLFNGVLSYTLFSFLSVYITKYIGFSLAQGIFYNLFGLIAFMSMCPVFGAFSDQITPLNSLKLAGRMCLFIPAISFFLFQMNSGFPIIMGQLLLGTLVASFVGPSHYFLQTLFPTNNRYTGASVGFTIGMAITGGSTPLILTFLLNTFDHLMVPAIYLSLWGIIWLIVLNILHPRIKLSYSATGSTFEKSV